MSETTIEIKNYLFLKGRLKSPKSNIFCIFMIQFIEDTAQFVKSVVAASPYSVLFETPVNTAWNKIEDTVNEFVFKGEIDRKITTDILQSFKNSIQNDDTYELFERVKDKNLPTVESFLMRVLSRPLEDKNIDLELHIEKVSAEEVHKLNAEKSKSAESTGEKESQPSMTSVNINVPDTASVVDVEFVLAPVSGIPIYDLYVGQRIIVKISPKSPKGKYFAEMLGAYKESEYLPLPGAVTQVEMNELGEYVIIAKLAENVYGKVSEAEKVKIRQYDPQSDGSNYPLFGKNISADKSILDRPKNKKRDFSIVIYIIGFLLLLALVLLLFLNPFS